mgnify:CR=1 FL=1
MSQTAKEYCDNIIANLLGYKVTELEVNKHYFITHLIIEDDVIKMCITDGTLIEVDNECEILYMSSSQFDKRVKVTFNAIGNVCRFFDTEDAAYSSMKTISDYIENIMLAKRI